MGIFSKTKEFFAKIKRIWSYRKLLGLVIIFLIGLVLICTAAFVLKGTPLIIALTVGSVLIVISWGKMTFNVAVSRAIRLQEAEKIKEENRQLLERESILKQQLEEARNRKLQVLNVQPILNLSVLEATCEVTKCFDFTIDKNGKIINDDSSEEQTGFSGLVKAFFEGFFGLRGNTRFVGTLIFDLTATYGIKLQNLKIRRDDNSKTIYVEGAQPTYTGLTGVPQTRWEGCVVLSERGESGLLMMMQ